ncbi:KICSTOR complex protein ITFG2-like isoform X1 [Daktulosphaira vitifoliae]|uniref:KICSTOR complex protein ITFG2-like isoform X1 n=1 Tax=Daktulosphaira vitifoliae TaxID=58002 RepID=UPI0021A9EB7E|nr:KICSTOR complex protein ITFG2-like isoform X1 [Daktulosphaira vitifoliae]XP_050529138.1 KICSTOR complex protein ITFG2-like isoform X1 [Daktulosphaira vitifoliae]XP_050529139.1 KICSTOR complex protein ITFG2-like isoform X1 [Daktulosphaira vitifoliae]
MKVASFVHHCEFDVPGNVYKNAIVLGDVDNDNDIELVVGNMEGDLYIFKGQRQIQKISGLGIITAIGIGDLMNCGSNTLIVICGDGWCHIYLCLKLCKSELADECIVKLEPVHVQRIPANTKEVLLGDIDGDGFIELIVGLTDRVIRSYRWAQSAAAGRLVPLHKWECANQIGSMILNKDNEGRPCLLVSQPGATAMRIYCPTTHSDLIESTIKLKNFQSMELRNPSISSEIIGNLKLDGCSECDPNNLTGSFCAISTLDGILMLVKEQVVLWSKKIDQQLFCLKKLSLTDDGPDYLISCSWNGDTYIVDQQGHIVMFQLGESVTAFCSGMYTIKSNEKPVPCFVFITFNHKVFIYYDIKLPKSNLQSLSRYIENDSELLKYMEKMNIYSSTDRKKLIDACLYKYFINCSKNDSEKNDKI